MGSKSNENESNSSAVEGPGALFEVLTSLLRYVVLLECLEIATSLVTRKTRDKIHKLAKKGLKIIAEAQTTTSRALLDGGIAHSLLTELEKHSRPIGVHSSKGRPVLSPKLSIVLLYGLKRFQGNRKFKDKLGRLVSRNGELHKYVSTRYGDEFFDLLGLPSINVDFDRWEKGYLPSFRRAALRHLMAKNIKPQAVAIVRLDEVLNDSTVRELASLFGMEVDWEELTVFT